MMTRIIAIGHSQVSYSAPKSIIQNNTEHVARMVKDLALIPIYCKFRECNWTMHQSPIEDYLHTLQLYVGSC